MDKSVRLLESVYGEPNFGSLCAFLYNIKSGVPFSIGDTERSGITPMLNSSANMNGGYWLVGELFDFATQALITLEPIKLEDFGITIIMFLFARYYAHNQYAIMINTLHSIKEIEHLELYLKQYATTAVPKRSQIIHNNVLNCMVRSHLNAANNEKTDRVSPIVTANLATDERYGIAANAARFRGTRAITLDEYTFIVRALNSKTLTVDNFISLINEFHIRIVESFYIMTSITKDSKVVNECRELSIRQMKYKFARPVRSAVYSGDYWFLVPTGAIWFAYSQGFRTYQSYVSRDADKLLDAALDNVKSGVLVGFIHDNVIHPVIMDSPECNGDWERTIETFSRHNLPIIFHDNRATPPPLTEPNAAKHLFFVKENVTILYKYIK